MSINSKIAFNALELFLLDYEKYWQIGCGCVDKVL